MRTIVVGDVQGCSAELADLMKRVEYSHDDRLILAGDLLDRGPDSVGVVQLAMELGAEMVVGNHDDNHLRFRVHRLRELHSEVKNPMWRRMFMDDFRKIQETMPVACWEWMKDRPSFLCVNDKWRVVHAGCLPGAPVAEQYKDVLQHMRYVRRANNTMAPLREIMLPSTHAYWTELWTGPESIVYGHHVNKDAAVLTTSYNGQAQSIRSVRHGESILLPTEGAPAVRTLGLDTGCCFGGSLTAAVFVNQHDHERIDIASVPARATYAEFKGHDL